MDPALHKAATQGNILLLKLLLTANPETLLSLTPQRNTALHIACRLGNIDIASEILRECKAILVEKNLDGDTPLHLASKCGKMAIIDLLINYSKEWPLDIESQEVAPLKMVNYLGNTALHEAITHGKSEVALRLLEADLAVGNMLNKKKESPLHLAAREGMSEVVHEILRHPWVEVHEETEPTVCDTGTPLHQAVLGDHIRIVAMLLYYRGDFVKKVDSAANNALHYAAQTNNAKIVEMLLNKDSSLAYLTNNQSQPPLHMAVHYGSTSSIKAILKHCPDTAEQFEPNGGNAFHVAVSRGKLSSLKCLLKNIQFDEIINHQDNDGNTPLHLAAMLSRTQSSLLLIRDKRVDPCKLNNKGQTARSVIETLEASTYDMFVWKELKKHEAKRCKKQQLPPVLSSRSFARKKPDTKYDYFELTTETYTVIATLIATVTFAANFSLPGGYNNQSGAAILAKNTAFKTFMIANTIALCSALVVVFCFIWAGRHPGKFTRNPFKWGHKLTLVAFLSMIVSIMTVIFLAVESQSRWLAFVVISIGCCTCIVVWLMLLW